MMQAILSAAIPLPTVGILAYFVLKQQFGKWQILGGVLVIIASVVQVTASLSVGGDQNQTNEDVVFWSFIFAVGLIAGSLITIVWEIGLSWYGVHPIALMLWSTVYTIPMYAIAIGVHGWVWGWEDETTGFRCFFGGGKSVTSNNTTCSSVAWISVTGYGLTSVLSDYVQIYLVSLDSAFFLLIADAVTTPLLAIIFSLPLFGKDTEPFTWQSVVSTTLVVVGMLVYKKSEIQDWWQQRQRQRQRQSQQSDELSLLMTPEGSDK